MVQQDSGPALRRVGFFIDFHGAGGAWRCCGQCRDDRLADYHNNRARLRLVACISFAFVRAVAVETMGLITVMAKDTEVRRETVPAHPGIKAYTAMCPSGAAL